MRRDLVARFEGSPNFREVVHLGTEADIAPAIDSRSVLMVVHIRQDFSRDVAAGRPGTVQLILDGRSSNASADPGRLRQQIIDSLQHRACRPGRVGRRRRPASS